MGKKPILDVSNDARIEIHKLNFQQSDIHADFGLWMCLVVRGNRSTIGLTRQVDMLNLPQNLRIFKFYSISHMYEGSGFYYSPKTGFTKVKAGDCIITLPDTVHLYGACANDDNLPYIEDNICFAGPLAEHFRRSGILQNQIVNLGTERRLLPIMEKAMNPSRNSQIEANLLLIEFLSSIYRNNRQRGFSGLAQKITMLTRQIQQEPGRWWSIREMAEYLHICESYFRSEFQKLTGLSPKLYIDKVKMGIAIEQLRRENCRIYELAHMLGYVDQYHFSRRFKQITGVSPRHYRKLS